MTAKKTMLKFAAFAAALTLTTGTAIPETLLSAIPVTASAEESYTTGTEGNLKYMKYSDMLRSAAAIYQQLPLRSRIPLKAFP